jgi:hypothetical protein
MDVGNWISVFMALIASTSAAITYVVYRSVTDPEVIIYADIDLKRPSIVNLIIKNIGTGPAVDITFHPERPLPCKAFSIEPPKEMPTQMTDGPIIVGIPYLAPGQKLTITWGQYGGLEKYLGTSSLSVTTKYKRSRGIRPHSAFMQSESKLDIQAFSSAESSNHHWGPKLIKTIESSNKELAKINKSIIESISNENS